MLQNSYETTAAADRRRFLKLAAVGVLGAAIESPARLWAGADETRESLGGKELIVRSASPPNAEPALQDLVRSWITPVKHFYVRSHAPTPRLDAETFRVSVEGLVEKPASFSVAELRERFESVSTVATMCCAGNRRTEHSLVKPVGGVQWDAGPLGNAEWRGARLSDILESVRVKGRAKHVWFESVDRIQRDGGVIPFGASIPLEKALGDSAEAPGGMVAYHMNGQPLHPDHGFPLRTVVPGYIGARSVKWLGKIIVSDRPSPNHYVATAYKLVTEGTDDEWRAAGPIYQLPLNSAICTPAAGAEISGSMVRVSGYALPPGLAGRTIARVEVSSNGGASWTAARLHPKSRQYCWRLWEADVPVNRGGQQLIVRAVDSAGNVQPKTVKWNLKGYMFNAWHRVGVKVS